MAATMRPPTNAPPIESMPPMITTGKMSRPSWPMLTGSTAVWSAMPTPASAEHRLARAHARPAYRGMLTRCSAASSVESATARIRTPTLVRCRPSQIAAVTRTAPTIVTRSSALSGMPSGRMRLLPDRTFGRTLVSGPHTMSCTVSRSRLRPMVATTIVNRLAPTRR